MDLLTASTAGLAAVVALTFVFGGLVKGVLGFGLPLTTMAILPYFLPVEAALTINALVSPFANVNQFLQQRVPLETVSRFRWVLAGLCFGVPLGAVFVSAVDEAVLLTALGIFVVGFTLLSAATPRLSLPARGARTTGAGVGFAAGVIGALTTANGPLLVIYLVALGVDRRMFISALGLMFIVTGLLISGSFLAVGLVTGERIGLAVIALTATFGGMWIGNLLAGRIPAVHFRRAVLGALVILGANLFFKGAGGL